MFVKNWPACRNLYGCSRVLRRAAFGLRAKAPTEGKTMSKKLLLALAACLPLALAGCLGGGGGGGCRNIETGAPVPCPENIARHNRAVQEWNNAYHQVTAAKSTASEKMSAARSSRSQAAISAAIAANTAYETAARNALAAAQRARNAGVQGSGSDITSQRANLNEALGWQREIARLSGGSSGSGGSGGSGSLPSDTGIERADPGDGDREQVATWNAVVARHETARLAANAATRAYNAAPSQARGQAAIAAIETLIRLKENLVTRARNWRGSGLPVDLATLQSDLQSWQNLRNEWRTAVAGRFGGSGSGGSGSGGSGSGASNVRVNSITTTLRHQLLIANPSRSTFSDPHNPSSFPNFAITTDTVSHSFSNLQNWIDRYVVSNNRNRYLSDDGYRTWQNRNGIETFIKTSRSNSFGPYGGFRSRSGTRYFAQSPRGHSTGTFYEGLRDTFGRGQYSAYYTDAHLACRKDAYVSSSSGWRWTGDYCEGFSFARAFGDRLDARPSISGTWRGAMTGDELISGAALVGDVALTYSRASNSVDIAITNISQRRVFSNADSHGNGFQYQGPSSFRWNSVNVNSSGRFIEDSDRSYNYIGGYFYGPEGQEAAGAFARQFPNGCPASLCPALESRDGYVIGGFVAKKP